MQQPPPAPQRPHILTWLVAFGLVALLVWQVRLSDQIKQLKQDRDDLSTKLEAANQQLAEVSQVANAAQTAANSIPVPNSNHSPQTEARLTHIEQRLEALRTGAVSRRPLGEINSASSSPATVNNEDPAKRAWGEEQATGAPNTPVASDASTAWASKEPDAGHEWLAVQFARSVDIAEVRIRESYNPGAITKVVALVNNQETVLWEGTANVSSAPRDFVVPVTSSIQSATIHIHLDTAKISGWNEIDAVELVGKDGSRQWAASAAASSTYAARTTASNP